ncbi:MAG: HAMP domain-containing protein [Faecalibacterium prausnitzii]
MAQGDYAVHVRLTARDDELGDLAQEFNHMAKEVQHALPDAARPRWPTSPTTCAPRSPSSRAMPRRCAI